MQNRSFKDYVKNKVDNQLWAEVEQFLTKVDSSTLDLRLQKVRSVGEIELYDTEVQLAYVSDLPGTQIEFDVVLDATLIVHDADQYHNDQTDAVHQWFMLQCIGDLACKLKDTTVKSVELYNGKNKQKRPLSDSLVPIISRADLEKEAEEFLRQHYPKALLEPAWIDPLKLADNMGLSVKRVNITKDMTSFGRVFFEDSEASTYDSTKDEMVPCYVKKGTVFVDPEVAFQRNLGAYNNTIVHECVHWHLHKKAMMFERLYNENAASIECKVVGGTTEKYNEPRKWMEWQANSLAPRIQMPYKYFKQRAGQLIKETKYALETNEICDVIELVIRQLSTEFAVSATAAKIRMIDIGYEEAAGALIYLDGHYVKPHRYKKEALKPNQTYSISATDAAILSLTNNTLRSYIRTGNYLYVDSHFVFNSTKFVLKNSAGQTVLTDYALHHMDECCIPFDLVIQDDIEEKYHTECFLNRGQDSPFKFDIIFDEESTADLCGEEKTALLNESVTADWQLARKLPSDFRDSLRMAIDESGLSIAEIERRASLSEKTVGRILKGETSGSLKTLIAICLVMHLGPKSSQHIIAASPHNYDWNNTSHQWYDFVLTYKYPESFEIIQAFLASKGAEML